MADITFDWSISIPAAVSIIGAIVSGVVTASRLFFRVQDLEKELVELHAEIEAMQSSQATNTETLTALMKLNQERLETMLREYGQGLMEFKVYVERNFAGNSALEKMESRVMAELRIMRGAMERHD